MRLGMRGLDSEFVRMCVCVCLGKLEVGLRDGCVFG